jgi:hypothetical protein
MKNILLKTMIFASLMLSTSSFADISLDSVGFNVGMSHINYKQKDNTGSIILGNEPDEKFITGELYTTLKGICNREDMKPYLSYIYGKNSELQNHILLGGINKYYKVKNTKLYTGIVAGYGLLRWGYNPLNNTKDNDYTAKSFLGGIQFGFNYPIKDNYELSTNIKYILHNYKTDLIPNNTASSVIEHKSSILFSIGINYFFN